MKKLWLGLALIVAMLVVPGALATPPTHVPITAADFTDSTSCGFPVDIHVTMASETATFLSDGTIIVTGPVMVTASANGKSVSLNVSGPTKISPSGTIIGHGVGVGPLQLPGGGVTLAYSTGQADITTSPATLLHGHVLLDVCAALAA
jgi:hypothetical protein